MNFKQESILSRIIADKLSGGITDEEQSLLDKWLDESPLHAELYGRIMSGETIREREKLVSTFDPRTVIGEIDRKLRRRRSRRISAWTGSAAAVMVAGAFLFFPQYRNTRIDVMHEWHAPLISFNGGEKMVLDNAGTGTEWVDYLAMAKESFVGGKEPDTGGIIIKIDIPRGSDIYKLKLADGSTVWLNSETVIEYPEKFGEGPRSVRLASGEAFFDIAEDRERPFTIGTRENVTVRVTGTSFNITAYGDEETVTTTLVDGSVEISTPHGSAGLSPGRKAVVGQGGEEIIVSEADVSRANLWTTGIFDFDAVTLADICARLSRWYDVDFVFEDGTGSERFSGRVRINDPLQSFLDNISTVTDVTFKDKQGRIIVRPK